MKMEPDRNMAMETTALDRPESMIAERLSGLDSHANDLLSELVRLRDRLAPVLDQIPDQEKGSVPHSAATVPLVVRITEVHQAVTSAREVIAEIHDRLAV